MSELSYDWLNTLLIQLPEPQKARKTIYDIAGFPRWENVNSNTLAFYLDENEEHGFGRLFFNSLLRLLIQNNSIFAEERELFETTYSVEREVYATSKRIDIVIRSTEGGESSAWNIVIENKLYAGMYNDLEVYWNSIKAKRKVGVVISLFNNTRELKGLEQSTGIHFSNILHIQLIEAVQRDLFQAYMDSDDRHLLMLKDYFQNIQNMTQVDNNAAMEKQLHLYRQYADEIDKLKKIESSLKEYSIKSIIRSMESFRFVPATGYVNVKAKHFYASDQYYLDNQIKYPKYFRFYLWMEELVDNGAISVFFELYGEFTKYGPRLRQRIREEGLIVPPASIGLNGGENYEYYHLLVINHYSLNDNSMNLEEQVSDLFRNVFFNESFNVVQKCTKWVEEIIKVDTALDLI